MVGGSDDGAVLANEGKDAVDFMVGYVLAVLETEAVKVDKGANLAVECAMRVAVYFQRFE